MRSKVYSLSSLVGLRRIFKSAEGHLGRLPTRLFAIVLLISAFAVTYNLQWYPKIWHDEALHLQIPLNLVRFGRYATYQTSGFKMLDFRVMVGPSVLLPIALVFKLFGVGLLQARAVIAIFFLLMLSSLYALSSHYFDDATALFGAVVFLFLGLNQANFPMGSPIWLGRTIVGGVPALFYFLLGVLLWSKAMGRASKGLLIGSGLCFGLAILAKNFYGLLLVPFAAMWLFDALHRKRLVAAEFLIPFLGLFVCGLFWFGYIFHTLGPAEFYPYMRVILSHSGTNIAVLSTARITLKALAEGGFFLWAVPGILYQGVLWLREVRRGYDREFLVTRGFLLVFVVVWLPSYVFISRGVGRYVVPAMAVVSILIGKLLVDLTRELRSASRGAHWQLTFEGSLPIVALLIGILTSPHIALWRLLVSTPDKSAHEFAQFILANVSENEIIESKEWEIDFLTSRAAYSYNHDYWITVAKYYIDGWYSKWAKIYPREFLSNFCELLFSSGYYDLYRELSTEEIVERNGLVEVEFANSGLDEDSGMNYGAGNATAGDGIPDGWHPFTYPGADPQSKVTVSIDETISLDGRGSVRIETDSPSKGPDFVLTAADIPVRPNEWYHLSGYLRTLDGAEAPWLELLIFDAEGNRLGGFLHAGTLGVKDSWLHLTLNRKMPASAAYVTIRLRVYHLRGVFWCDQVRLYGPEE